MGKLGKLGKLAKLGERDEIPTATCTELVILTPQKVTAILHQSSVAILEESLIQREVWCVARVVSSIIAK